MPKDSISLPQFLAIRRETQRVTIDAVRGLLSYSTNPLT
jgi:hypothetical protein